MAVIKTLVLFAAFMFVKSANAQKELTPEPGAVAGMDRYDSKIREVFHEAYAEDVVLRGITLPSFFPETVVFVDEKNHLITLSPKKTSIWSHEYRELVRQGTITRSNADGQQIPPYEENEIMKRIPEKVSDIVLVRRSRRLPPTLVKLVSEVWEDALMHATHEQEDHRGLDGISWHFSMKVREKGELAGSVWLPDDDTIPSALLHVRSTLIDYVSKDANESHVASAVWKYKVATKIRDEGMAEISIEESPEVIPIPFSMSRRITERTILDDFTVDDVRLDVALQQLTAESAKWGEIIGYEGVKFSAAGDLAEMKVAYKSEGETMRFICEELALQIGAEFEFKDSEVLFVKKAE